MKKLIAVIIVAALCIASLFALVSCDPPPEDTKAPDTTAAQNDTTTVQEETTAEEQTTAEEETTVEEETTAEEATTAEDVTTAEETTVKEEQTTEGGDVEYEQLEAALYVYNDPHNPISAADGRELACKFSLEPGERLVGLILESCPTWTQEKSGFIIELYKWDNDYDNTVIGDAIYSAEYSNWKDNAELRLDFTSISENGLPAGTYLWVFRGTTADIGIWAMEPAEECEYFENGMNSYNGFRSRAVVLSPV